MEKKIKKVHSNEDLNECEEEPEPKWKGPFKAMLAIFLLLIVIMWVVPSYSVRLNPEPSSIPSLEEVQANFLNGIEISGNAANDIREAASMIRADGPAVRPAAAFIASKSCPESRVCHAKALYYFVRDNIRYVSDPSGKEYIASPIETLKAGAGDCDDGAILMASLLESVGIMSQIVVIPGHALVKASIPEAGLKQSANGWVYMDWACKSCSFGEVPYSDAAQIYS